MNKPNRLSYFSFFAGVLTVGAAIFFCMAVYFGNNPLNRSFTIKQKMVSILPEGWAFFTKSAKDPMLYVFSYENGQLHNMNLRNFSSQYCFGFSRENRLLNVETGTIIQAINKKTSLVSKEIKLTDIDSLSSLIDLKNARFDSIVVARKNVPDFKGRYVFLVQKMLPWSLKHKRPSYPSYCTVCFLNIIQHG